MTTQTQNEFVPANKPQFTLSATLVQMYSLRRPDARNGITVRKKSCDGEKSMAANRVYG
jgi:hypothetical protein